MKKYHYIILAIILISILLGTMFFVIKNVKKDNENIELENIANNDVKEENRVDTATTEEIENMKKVINSTADTSIYQVEQESDGRKILQIKPEVQFGVDLVGIIKNAKPEEKELQELIKRAPTNNGVWISSQSRYAFMQLLNENNIENFSITEEGYLKIDSQAENEISKKIENMINNNKLYIINMTGIAYERDYISGEIVEYPFEDMDPTQIIEPYRNENTIILEVTTNKRNKLTSKEILETIVQY